MIGQETESIERFSWFHSDVEDFIKNGRAIRLKKNFQNCYVFF